jgi:hypothetical protein
MRLKLGMNNWYILKLPIGSEVFSGLSEVFSGLSDLGSTLDGVPPTPPLRGRSFPGVGHIPPSGTPPQL